MPYHEMQQGRSPAPNPSSLAIDVHLATLQLSIAAPSGTTLDVQLPAGSLVTSSLAMRRSDAGIGDLETRVRQSFKRSGALGIGATLGMVSPTGSYVARSGAANLAPEASYLTLGRGVFWWLAEIDARMRLARTTITAQLAGRGPLHRADDGFAWGSEIRGSLALQYAVLPWLTSIVSTDLQWRAGATEPDPFGAGRLTSANAGGWQWTVAPAASASLGHGVAITVGVRIPVLADVTGNQLVPGLGGFVAVSYARALTPRRTAFAPTTRRITVVDYWASWCEPCREISRILAAAAARWPDVDIVKIDASAWPNDGAPALPTGASGLPVVEVFDATGKRHVLLVGDAALRVVDEVEALRSTRDRATCERTDC